MNMAIGWTIAGSSYFHKNYYSWCPHTGLSYKEFYYPTTIGLLKKEVERANTRGRKP
jgi:hypothetical protein